jgi:hypothetical protein
MTLGVRRFEPQMHGVNNNDQTHYHESYIHYNNLVFIYQHQIAIDT